MRFKQLNNKSVIILGVVIGILLFQTVFMQSFTKIEGGFKIENRQAENLRSADYWVLPHRIHIDNNWSDTATDYDWCTGLGTPQTPYRIENVTIDAQNSGSCIYIENTYDNFIIQNCTLTNSEASPHGAIGLYFVSNGKIIDNNITNNNIFSNHENGIALLFSDNNIFSKNNFESNKVNGFYLDGESKDNIIFLIPTTRSCGTRRWACTG